MDSDTIANDAYKPRSVVESAIQGGFEDHEVVRAREAREKAEDFECASNDPEVRAQAYMKGMIPRLVRNETARVLGAGRISGQQFDCVVPLMIVTGSESSETPGHGFGHSLRDMFRGYKTPYPDWQKLKGAAYTVFNYCQTAGLNPVLEDNGYGSFRIVIRWNLPTHFWAER